MQKCHILGLTNHNQRQTLIIKKGFKAYNHQLFFYHISGVTGKEKKKERLASEIGSALQLLSN